MTIVGLPVSPPYDSFTGTNQTATYSFIPAFSCPSTPRATNKITWDFGAAYSPLLAGLGMTVKGGVMDYSSTAKADDDIATASGETSNRGIMSDEQAVSIRHVTDGLSNTTIIGERAGAPEVWRKGKKIGASTTFGGTWNDPFLGASYFSGSLYDGTGSTGQCVINCTNEKQHGMYSFHSGTATVLLADGSARSLNENTSSQIVGRLVSFAGGLVVGEF